jgi:hypothetical protein
MYSLWLIRAMIYEWIDLVDKPGNRASLITLQINTKHICLQSTISNDSRMAKATNSFTADFLIFSIIYLTGEPF